MCRYETNVYVEAIRKAPNMSSSKAPNQDTDSVVDSTEVSLSDDEISHLRGFVLPKTRRNFFLLCLIYLAMLPILPYFPAKITQRTLIERMDYWSAIELCCWAFGLLLCLLYYLAVVRLKQDIRQGKKHISALLSQISVGREPKRLNF